MKGKSDPYVKINIGGETFTSNVIKGNLNPTWNEMYEVNTHELMHRWTCHMFISAMFYNCFERVSVSLCVSSGDPHSASRPGAACGDV